MSRQIGTTKSLPEGATFEIHPFVSSSPLLPPPPLFSPVGSQISRASRKHSTHASQRGPTAAPPPAAASPTTDNSVIRHRRATQEKKYGFYSSSGRGQISSAQGRRLLLARTSSTDFKQETKVNAVFWLPRFDIAEDSIPPSPIHRHGKSHARKAEG